LIPASTVQENGVGLWVLQAIGWVTWVCSQSVCILPSSTFLRWQFVLQHSSAGAENGFGGGLGTFLVLGEGCRLMRAGWASEYCMFGNWEVEQGGREIIRMRSDPMWGSERGRRADLVNLKEWCRRKL
jgi:hypothetical protein